MARVRSFKPISAPDAEVLILGSMPGVKSLQAGRYYAHPQNAFWRIVTELLRLPAVSSYEERVRALKSARIAVWDVLKSCEREGSLDASIEDGTLIANDFRRFFRSHPGIREVFFNGAKAEACFRRHVLSGLQEGAMQHREGGVSSMRFTRLPSTSPAHAGMPYARKRDAWRAILSPRGRSARLT
jgi:TDG/mug DNA glycosylase family protein